MTRRALFALGVGQCVNWGVLYYAFTVLLLPVERELGVSTWVVTGAFSLALLVSAALAPRVGVWCDRGAGSTVMLVGGVAASLLLAVWTVIPGIAALYAVWAGLGLCMATSLYEPAFIIVGRGYADAGKRLRALAAVTLFGGLASTVFLPSTAYVVATFGWRAAVLALAAVMLTSTVITRRFLSHDAHIDAAVPKRLETGSLAGRDAEVEGARFVFLAGTFALASLASSGLYANLVAALSERGVSAATAAGLGGLIGIMQLPGRVLLMNGALAGAPTLLLTASLGLHAAGLGGVAFTASTLSVAAGTAVFALGAGLTALVRPYLVQHLADKANSGYLNGRIARQQQLARAAGPLLMAWLASRASYTALLGAMAVVFIVSCMAWSAAGVVRPQARARHEESRTQEGAI